MVSVSSHNVLVVQKDYILYIATLISFHALMNQHNLHVKFALWLYQRIK